VPLAERAAGTIGIQGHQVKLGVQRAHRRHEPDHPPGRGGTPTEAAGAIYLICSPGSDGVSGQTLVVHGGT